MISRGGSTTPRAQRPAVAEGSNEIRIATDRGGDGTVDVLFVHATGFCKEVWQPVIDRVSTQPWSWLSMDLRGHGGSDPGSSPNDWDLLIHDVFGVIDDEPAVVGVGHSAGGGLIARAEAVRPGTFRHLVLIEPIIFPPPFQRIDGPLSEGTRKRRTVFPSRDAAFERFASGPFGSWTSESLTAYIDHGFRATGAGWELKCSPEVEADFYVEGLNHDTWDRVEDIDVPVTLIAGERSSTYPETHLNALASRFRRVDVIVVPDAGHLLPMEDPGLIARIVDDVIPAG